MSKKVRSWILIVVMMLFLSVAISTPVNAQPPEYNFQIVETGVEYATLDAAIEAASSGQTIKLLTDITYGAMISAHTKSFTLDVSGYTLTVNALNATCLYAGNEFDLSITDSATGGSVVLTTSGGTGLAGLYANGHGSEINIDVPTSVNVAADSSYGVFALTGGIVSVTGDITVTGIGSLGAFADSGVYGSLVTIDGEIINTINNSYAYVNGHIFSGPGECITPTTKEGYYTFRDTGDSANPQSTVWVKEITYVAEVDGVQYETFDEAITAAAVDWDTIKLLADIDYAGGLAPTFDMYINLNGYTLNVVNDSGIGLYADGRDISISGEGEFNITGTTYGVYTCDGGSAEVTNVTSTAAGGRAVYVGDSNCSVTVKGDATANGENGVAVYTGDSAPCTATIEGDVYANGTGGIGAWAISGSQITVMGRIHATNYIQVGATVKAEGDYSSIANNYYVYTDGSSTVQARQEVCSLDGTNYLFLEDALADAESGDTITLLADIRYVGDIVLIEKDLHFDLDTYKLNIGKTGSDGALKADGSNVTIDDSDGGELNIVTGYVGVRVLNEGSATVTSISGLNGYGIIGESDGSVTVKNDISVTDYIGSGMYLYSGATAHVMGNIISLDGITVQQSGSEAIIGGYISATSGPCAYVTNGGSIIVHGDVHGNYRAVQGGNDGGTIHIMGDVVADRWEGVYAWGGADITVDGSVTSPYGLYAWSEGTTVLVKGNTVTTASVYENTTDATYGAYASGSAEITVGGTITPATAANYVKVGETVMTEAEGVLQGHYTIYSDGTSSVRLKGIEFYKEDFESESLEGWTTPHTDWVLTDSLTNPIATAHSGSQVAMFNSYDTAFGMEEPFYQTIGLNLTNGSAYQLEFWMYHDNENESCYDGITVQISTDGGNTWTPIGSAYYRFSNTVGWKKEAIDLSAYVGEPDVRIAFLGHSEQGNNIFIDDVSVSHECIIDGCSTTEAYGGYIASSQIGDETYYHVSTPEQLAHINDHLDLNFIQTADIDLSEYNGGQWIPIGGFGDPDDYCTPENFTGKYLGDEHTIDNLYCFYDGTQNATHSGIFAAIRGAAATVRDLTVTVAGANMTNYNYAYFGAIAANMDGGSIDNCHVVFKGDIVTQTPNGYAGGIVGSSYPIYDSESDSYVGSIENCTVTFDTGSILTDGWSKYAGGIVGRGALSIIDCHVVINEGETIKAPFVGGIAGSADKMRSFNTYMENCTVTGAGTLELFSQHDYSAYIGGIAGMSWDGDLRNCDNEVDVIANLTMINDNESAYAGGIVGYTATNSSIFGCDNTGAVNLTIANNVVDSYGDPTTPGGEEYAYAGGITGFINGYSRASVIENCENNADITAINLIPTHRAYAGGIVGHIECDDAENAGVTVKNCANTGADKTVAAYGGSTLTGGIAGSSTYTDFDTPNILIEDCYNYSEVYSESNSGPKVGTMCIGLTAGGIIGAAGEITVNYCYSTAPDVDAVNNHDGDAYYGGIVGLIYNTALSQNYYETNSNVTRAAGGIVSGMDILAEDDVDGSYEGATATQLKTKSFYGSGWSWYTSGGTTPDYYSSSAPWRMTSSDSYPVLKGEPIDEPETPTGGGGTYNTYYTITASAGVGGSIDPSGIVSLQKYQSKTFMITPQQGYIIADVLIDGVSVGIVTEYTFSSINADHTINAVFEHPSKRYTDVDISLWYREGIDYVLISGLFNGMSDTTFQPNTNMTRAMLVTVLWRLDKEPDSNNIDLFSDIAQDIWYTEAVAWAADNGIVQGYSADTFGPNDPITREQMAAILYRFAFYKGYDTTATVDLSSFNDAGNTSDWALTAMKWAVAEGLINGVSGTELDPTGYATRAQVATILMRFVQNIVK